MLNAQGKVICDMLIYRTPSTSQECRFYPPGQATKYDELLIDCDSDLATGLANTLYAYRVRRKISLSVENELHLWSLFPTTEATADGQITTDIDESNSVVAGTSEMLTNDMIVVNDPRLLKLGLRIISNTEKHDIMKSKMSSLINTNIHNATLNDYILHRYCLGVGEGSKDHPQVNCIPLECNADYLGSVSFDKGCYLGQELISRIHYTGVIRKRLMPITFESRTIPMAPGTNIIDEISKKKIGILRNVMKNRGLALLRRDLVSQSGGLIHESTGTKIQTFEPFWWS